MSLNHGDKEGAIMLARLRALYEGNTQAAHRFRYALLIFDLLTIAFVVVTSFFQHTFVVEELDLALGVVILADFIARVLIERKKARYFLKFATWADLIAIVSFLAPIAGEGLGFLRVLRTLRLLRTYQLMSRLKRDFAWFGNHEDIVMASINLCVFLFVMTGLIYALQNETNPEIGNFVDALYFTVTTLTTTGFGDITLTGTAGRLLSVAVMIFGVTLFLRLVQVLLRPSKVRHECPDCGLMMHDQDAVHCKHCGRLLHIRTEGE